MDITKAEGNRPARSGIVKLNIPGGEDACLREIRHNYHEEMSLFCPAAGILHVEKICTRCGVVFTTVYRIVSVGGNDRLERMYVKYSYKECGVKLGNRTSAREAAKKEEMQALLRGAEL